MIATINTEASAYLRVKLVRPYLRLDQLVTVLNAFVESCKF